MEPTAGPVGGVHGGHAEMRPINDAESPAALVCWIVTAPMYHPAWSQYALSVIRLADTPGVPPAVLRFPGATHELMVMALDPTRGPVTATTGQIGFLHPFNIVEQFEATDDEMRDLASLLVQAVVQGLLDPETSNGPERIRENWLTSAVKTLAHLRGEEHAP